MKIPRLQVGDVKGVEREIDGPADRCVGDRVPRYDVRLRMDTDVRPRARADDRQELTQVDRVVGAEVRRRVVGDRDRLRPAQRDVRRRERSPIRPERLDGLEERGVVREHVDVVERVELIGDDRHGARDAVCRAREGSVGPIVERSWRRAVDLAGAELEHAQAHRRNDGRGDLRRVSRCARRRVVLFDGDGRGDVRLRVAHDDGVLLGRGILGSVDVRVVEVGAPVLAPDVAPLLGGLSAESDAATRATHHPRGRIARGAGDVPTSIRRALFGTGSVALSIPRVADGALEQGGRADAPSRRAVIRGFPRRAPETILANLQHGRAAASAERTGDRGAAVFRGDPPVAAVEGARADGNGRSRHRNEPSDAPGTCPSHKRPNRALRAPSRRGFHNRNRRSPRT